MKRLLATFLLVFGLLSAVDVGATATRPTKTFGGTSYIDGVVPRASDFNGDLDTIYSAFNSFESSPAFTGDVSSTKTTPCFYWSDSSQAADSKRWYACVTSGVWALTTRSDAGSVQSTPISINRSSGVVTLSASPTITNAQGMPWFSSGGSLGYVTLNSLVIANGNAAPTNYGGASACSAGSFVTAISNVGATTCTAGASAASQAEMEAVSSTTTYVSPGRAKYHPGVAKGAGQLATGGGINWSYGITSISDTGTGLVTVTWSNTFANTDSMVPSVSTQNSSELIPSVSGLTSTTVTAFRSANTAGSPTDPTVWFVSIYGDAN